jgi:hypothetical protein
VSVSTFLTERENIRIEEMCDAINLALEEAEREESRVRRFNIGRPVRP